MNLSTNSERNISAVPASAVAANYQKIDPDLSEIKTNDVLGSIWFWIFFTGILLVIASIMVYVGKRENSPWLWLLLSLGIIAMGTGLTIAAWGIQDSYLSVR